MNTFSNSNYCKLITAILFVFVFPGNFSFAQTTEKSMRQVKGSVLSSKDTPKIRLKFDRKFKFAGSQEFVLYDRAKAGQYFFVEAEGKKIKRMFMVQFEGFLPDIDAKYDYNEPQTIEISGLKYFSNVEFVPNVEMAVKAVPDSDTARAAKFLQDKGFILMKSLVFQRFVRVIDETKRNEFILVYIEDAENDSAGQKEKLLQGLSERALKNFKVLK
jgi:hypothetical protein